MRVSILAASVVLWGICALPARAQTAPANCDACSGDVAAALAQCTCDLTNKSPHGAYVSCVARTLNDLVRAGKLDVRCKGKIRSCAAAKSICGKPAFETCWQNHGSCDTTTGLCNNGTLAAGLTACASDADCLKLNCSVKRSFPASVTPVPGQDRCTLLGGTIGGANCCCQ